jgi:hypothetical protein
VEAGVDVVEGSEVTQLHRPRLLGERLAGVHELCRRLLLALGVDYLGPRPPASQCRDVDLIDLRIEQFMSVCVHCSSVPSSSAPISRL